MSRDQAQADLREDSDCFEYPCHEASAGANAALGFSGVMDDPQDVDTSSSTLCPGMALAVPLRFSLHTPGREAVGRRRNGIERTEYSYFRKTSELAG